MDGMGRTWTWLAVGTVLFAAVGLAVAGDDEVEKIDVGAEAPDFRLNDQHGKALRLTEHGKGRWTIVAFYPKSDTPG